MRPGNLICLSHSGRFDCIEMEKCWWITISFFRFYPFFFTLFDFATADLCFWPFSYQISESPNTGHPNTNSKGSICSRAKLIQLNSIQNASHTHTIWWISCFLCGGILNFKYIFACMVRTNASHSLFHIQSYGNWISQNDYPTLSKKVHKVQHSHTIDTIHCTL